MTFDEDVLYKDKEKKGFERTKQVGVEVKLQKNLLIDDVIETQETSGIVAEEP